MSYTPQNAWSKTPQTGITSNPGPFLAEVVRNDDPLFSGRLLVYIPDMGGNPDQESSLHLVRYMTPYYGIQPLSNSLSADAADPENLQSYGMWMTPPDVGVKVLVMFINGDRSRGVWIGCLPEIGSHAAIPGQDAGDFDVYKNYSAANNDIKAIPRPEHSTRGTFDVQGLGEDEQRGPITSSSFRESPSKVFGFNTPGSHSFVMDDGDESGKNKIVRLRTANGNQIMMNDDSGFIYLINAAGTGWIELSPAGHIDVYGESGINMATRGSINMHADKNINIHAGEHIKIVADIGAKLQGTEEMQIHGGRLWLEGVDTIEQHSCGQIKLTGYNGMFFKSFDNFVLQGKCFRWNSGTALEAEQVPPEQPKELNGYSTTVERAPSNEPWEGHATGDISFGTSVSSCIAPLTSTTTSTGGTSESLIPPTSNVPGTPGSSINSGTSGTVAGNIPTSADVAQEATISGVNTSQLAFLGASGTPTARRGIVRFADGRTQTLIVGDSFNGGTVTSITEDEIRFSGATVNRLTRLDLLPRLPTIPGTSSTQNTISQRAIPISPRPQPRPADRPGPQPADVPGTSRTPELPNRTPELPIGILGTTNRTRDALISQPILQPDAAAQQISDYLNNISTTPTSRPLSMFPPGAEPIGTRPLPGGVTQPIDIDDPGSLPPPFGGARPGDFPFVPGTPLFPGPVPGVDPIEVSSPPVALPDDVDKLPPVVLPIDADNPSAIASEALSSIAGQQAFSSIPALPGGGNTGYFATGDNCARPVAGGFGQAVGPQGGGGSFPGAPSNIVPPAALANDPEWQAQLAQLKQEFPQLDEQELYRTIQGESRFNTTVVNDRSGATGLFQFIPGTAAGLGTSTGEIQNMTPAQQLEVYGRYLRQSDYRGGPLGMIQAAPSTYRNLIRRYGTWESVPRNIEVYTPDTKAWAQNPGWRGPDQRITIGSIESYYARQ